MLHSNSDSTMELCCKQGVETMFERNGWKVLAYRIKEVMEWIVIRN